MEKLLSMLMNALIAVLALVLAPLKLLLSNRFHSERHDAFDPDYFGLKVFFYHRSPLI
jgi:hypothetical protein